MKTMKASKARKPTSQQRKKTDRRILRTRDTLGDALVALMHEKSFEQITVQEVLERAGVGRSTFYVHYRDKDDLFMSDLEEFLELVANMLKQRGADSKRLLPVQEFLAHLRDARSFYEALVKSGKMNDVLALARGIFARSIAERLESAGVQLDSTRLAAQAHALAGSFLSLMEWWVDQGMQSDPKEMDEVFHRMVWSGLSEAISR
ncbi:MAG: TetR/AcrR family transcriptional regulator [Candidatus Sulfotelmatobacter sp.]